MALLPLEDKQAGRLLASVPEELHTNSWWFILRDGTPVAGNNGGGIAVLTEVERTRPLASVLRAMRLSPLLDALDKLLARYRKNLSRFVPEGSGPRRYP